MKQVAIVSGKGGTGKTTIAASFSCLAKNKVIADCDVDSAMLHLLLKPEIMSSREFHGSKLYEIDESKCIRCGLCESHCRFNAIKNLRIEPFLCEGCAVCYHVCPVNAIKTHEKISGYMFTSKTKYGPMVHAKLNATESNSGKLVTMVRNKAKRIAEEENADLILIDGPPGLGCPLFATMTGIDIAIAVAEPTMSGIHDLERLIRVINHFRIKPIVIVNMYDVNEKNTEEILNYCRRNAVDVAGLIPFDKAAVDAIVNGLPVIDYATDSDISRAIKQIWNIMEEVIG
ncbi:MAG: ATP-binding protein [Thermoproteota archaeon]